MSELALSSWEAWWASNLPAPTRREQAPVLPSRDEVLELLGRLGVGEQDRSDVAATLPTNADQERLELVSRASAQIVACLGDSAYSHGFPEWVGALPLEKRCFGVHVFVTAVPYTLSWHEAHGIAPEVTWASLGDLARHMAIHRRVYGSTGVDNAWWLTLLLRGELFELGRLQFNWFRLGEGDQSPRWYAPAEAGRRGRGFRDGDFCAGVHIPESGPLTPRECDDSLSAAAQLLPDLLGLDPGRHRLLATCASWLLDDQLGAYLSKESNIMAFQSRFELVPGWSDDDFSPLAFVFRRPPGELADPGGLPKDTTLQRALVAHLAGGGHLRERTGWLDLAGPVAERGRGRPSRQAARAVQPGAPPDSCGSPSTGAPASEGVFTSSPPM
ncbi:MAG: acyltransferase domain-containing protein [Acidimicrobiales bacterium]